MKIDEIKNTIICGDSSSVLKTIPDNSVDCVITSPPYDNLREYNGYVFNFEGIAKELYRVVKQGGVIVWVVNDQTINGSETGTSFKQALYFKEIGFNLHDTMIYEKDGCPFPEQVRYYQIFEYMFIFSKGVLKTINLIKDRKNMWVGVNTSTTRRGKDGTLKSRADYNTYEYGVRFNVWKINCGQGKSATDEFAYGHPAIFPEKLAQDHILSWSNEGELILDPMCGSGTTCKMAKLLKRNYIGIDISKDYCELARKRIDGMPSPLF